MMCPDNVILSRTCTVSPEQYDAFDSRWNLIGYLRIRHGLFTVEAPDVGGTVVYEAMTSSNTGYFNDEERSTFLDRAKVALSDFYNGGLVQYRGVGCVEY